MQFQDVEQFDAKARLALEGPSGSGKTLTGLLVAQALCENPANLYVADSEHGSAAKYKRLVKFKHGIIKDEYHPRYYIDAIHSAEDRGAEALLVDSLSHAWTGEGGVLDIQDKNGGGNKFAGWKTATPEHRKLLDAIVQSPIHIVCTMRTKTEWIVEKNSEGKSVPKKVGTATVQRNDTDYEFDVVARLDEQHNMSFVKTRCPELDQKTFYKPGKDVAEIILRWLKGEDGPPPLPAPKPVTDPAVFDYARDKYGLINKAKFDVWLAEQQLTRDQAIARFQQEMKNVSA